MINVPKQIDYWKSTSESDIETASILISSGKYIEGMFFCHLCIEKIIKPKLRNGGKKWIRKTSVSVTEQRMQWFLILKMSNATR